jgi:hypothetical protein
MNTNNYKPRKLNRKEFATALQKGLGRTMLHVNSYGLKGVDDLVLKACLHDQSWDPQCEYSKSNWLFSMFFKTPYYPAFSKSIIKALKRETKHWDLQQLFMLSMEMALAGDEIAKVALSERALKQARLPLNDDGLGVEQFIIVYGTQGVLELARIYGQRLIENPNDCIPGDMWYFDRPNETEQKKILFENSQTDQAIKTYCDYLIKERIFAEPGKYRFSFRKQLRKEFPIRRILQEAQNLKGDFYDFRRWGNYASKKELELVYSKLIVEKKRSVRVRLLWCFFRAPLPRLDEVFFKWANGKDPGIKAGVFNVLANLKNARIHELAQKIFLSGALSDANTEALLLFVNNYQKVDAKLINQALVSQNPSVRDAHNLGLNLIKLASNNKDAKLSKALRWAYITTPCALCRENIVKLLDESGQLKSNMLKECLFDSNEETRKMAEQKIKSTF